MLIFPLRIKLVSKRVVGKKARPVLIFVNGTRTKNIFFIIAGIIIICIGSLIDHVPPQSHGIVSKHQSK